MTVLEITLLAAVILVGTAAIFALAGRRSSRQADESAEKVVQSRDEVIKRVSQTERKGATNANSEAEGDAQLFDDEKTRIANERAMGTEKQLEASSEKPNISTNVSPMQNIVSYPVINPPEREDYTEPVAKNADGTKEPVLRLENRPPKRNIDPQIINASSPRSPNPEIVCIQKQNAWTLRIELPQEILENYSDVQVFQNESRIEGEDGRWSLSDASGSVVVRSGSRDLWRTELGNRPENYLVFKLSGDYSQGYRVRTVTKGAYLFVVPEDWQLEDSIPEWVSLKDFHAHYRVVNERDEIAFRLPNGNRFPVRQRGTQFELVGNRLKDANEKMGPLFGKALPHIHASNSIDWQKVQTIIVGEEGRERKEWKSVEFHPDENKTEQALPPEIAQWQASWFFVRFYDTNAELIESVDFRFGRGLSAIRINQASPFPNDSGHSIASVEFQHVTECIIEPVTDLETQMSLQRSDTKTFVEIPPSMSFDRTDWRITEPGYEPIQVAILAERIWWALGTKDEAPLDPEWIDTPIALTRADFVAVSNKVLWIRLPILRWTEMVHAGFQNETLRQFPLSVEDQTIPVRLGDFESAASLCQIGLSRFEIRVANADATLANVRVQAKCQYCEFSEITEEKIIKHIEEYHAHECFQKLKLEELRKHVPSVPAGIYKCSYCDFYVVSHDPRNQTNAISDHIYRRRCPKVPQQGERPPLRFRVIDDPDEIRENVDKNLPDIRRCEICGKEIEWRTSQQAMSHLIVSTQKQTLRTPLKRRPKMDPITLSRQVEERYQRYLKTMFYFREPALRQSFAQALDAGHLSKGPFLEATPIFEKGDTPRTLFTHLLGFAPDDGFVKAMELEGGRRLHKHQHRAIERVDQGHNVIVATGTGSGKTEAFLYPILLHLHRQHQAGKLGAGVRALVLYPMNALANDQRARLDVISKKLQSENSSFRFTFGQYIGETPEGEKDTRLNANKLAGELKTRAEIRDTPPHILLTNYSMLEYLLIRPKDLSLFDNGQARWWTFLVLDEAHLYRGARGIEMAMLIRRLKQRLREGGCTGEFRCIATSATLVSDEEDRHAVAQFASDLFGEPFAEEDVILGETEEISLPDHRAAQLCRLITGNPLPVQEVADQVFGDVPAEHRSRELTNLVDRLTRTENPLTNPPVLSARYHLFLRSLEGAYIQFLPQERILLEKNLGDPSVAIFEIALCRECGQHYLVAPKDFKGGKLTEAVRDPSHDQFGATFLRPIEKDDDSGDGDEDTKPAIKDIYQLCVRCGEMAKDKPRCGHNDLIRVIKEASSDDDNKADQIKRCGACGYNAAGHDPVHEIVHGTDGPHSVIATTLYQNLERKKVLAFADSRQEAAFFAWYLDKSYHDILNRNLFLRIARSFQEFPASGISLAYIADRAMMDFHDSFGEKSDSEVTVRKNIWRALYLEFLTEEQRISLEGVGLIRWSIEFPQWFKVPDVLRQPPLSLSEPEARDLITLLLDTMRTRYAVELKCKGNVALNWQDLDLERSQTRFRIGSRSNQKNVESWNSTRANRGKLLEKLGKVDQSQIDQTLREIWRALTLEEDTPLLERIDDARRLNPNWWRLGLIAEQETIFVCSVCGRIQIISVRGICLRRGCPGKLRETSRRNFELDHYRALYEDDLPASLVVEEHTAQLDHIKAREFQQRFKDNKINILSCSTTFELGVDLGDLDTAFLRNVPPESFNYTQRVGRVGRRLGRPGFVVTYCRRNPHDLYHFNEPYRMLRGQTQPPTIALRNEKIISRHIAAVALSAFFRANDRFGTVEKLCKDIAHPSSVADLKNFLQQYRRELETSLRNIVPREIEGDVGLSDGTWVEKIIGAKSRFAEAEAELSSDYNEVARLRNESSQQYDSQQMGWANRRLDTIAKEDTLSFLSRKAVIPKYGFPVDVVELDTHRTTNAESNTVSLQRDLSIAISEFAPSSELIANKKVWKSYGLKKVVGKEWERWRYARCPRHNTYFERQLYSNDKSQFRGCCGEEREYHYIEPRFGFVTQQTEPKKPTGRPIRVFSTRPYFVGFKDGEEKAGEPINAVVSATKVSPGIMVVVCEGRRGSGFYICDKCGAGFQNRKQFEKGHDTPYGQNCLARPDTLHQAMLGHELLTDVLKLQFKLPPSSPSDSTWLAFALAYALVEGAAETLDVPSSDLSATVAYARDQVVPPIVLFDNVPGGAGLVARLKNKDTLKACLEAAQDRVSGKCKCREEDSCYGCLRNYRNQFAHPYLKRGVALEYLKSILSQWK